MKVTIGVNGMMCGMCETHVGETLRKAFPAAKKVKASRRKKQVTMEIDSLPSEQDIQRALEPTGYEFTGVKQ